MYTGWIVGREELLQFVIRSSVFQTSNEQCCRRWYTVTWWTTFSWSSGRNRLGLTVGLGVSFFADCFSRINLVIRSGCAVDLFVLWLSGSLLLSTCRRVWLSFTRRSLFSLCSISSGLLEDKYCLLHDDSPVVTLEVCQILTSSCVEEGEQ